MLRERPGARTLPKSSASCRGVLLRDLAGRLEQLDFVVPSVAEEHDESLEGYTVGLTTGHLPHINLEGCISIFEIKLRNPQWRAVFA